MKNVKFCRVSLDCIKYLYEFDNKVPYNIYKGDDYNSKRPFIGVVIEVNDWHYFAPLESPKPNHSKLKNNPQLIKIKNGDHDFGLISFNNMIPIKKEQLIEFDFKNENISYQNILKNQFIFCDNNKDRIQQKAEKTYLRVTNKKDVFTCSISCDFKLLEKKCKEYLGK